MLNSYKKHKPKSVNQFLLVDKSGIILENETEIFSGITNTSISKFHPFFESLIPLLNNSNQTYTFNCIHVYYNKTEYTLDIALETLANKEHNFIVINDLTTHYANNLKISQSKNVAAIKSQFLELENDLLIKKENFKRSFLTNFSHNIRMPINTITLSTSLLNNSEITDNQRHTLSVIDKTSNHLKEILNTLLDISKIETGYFPNQNQVFDIQKLLDNLKKEYADKFKNKGLRFNLYLDSKCPKFLLGNQFRIEQICNILLENAYTFTLEGEVNLNINAEKNKQNKLILNIQVEDTGIGIKKENLKAVFNAFYKEKNTIYNNGKGLGLALVKQLTQALNGEIILKSEPNEGSVFKVKLPLKISEQKIEASILQKEENSKKNARYKLLIADYFETDQIQLFNILNTEKQYKIDRVKTGDDVINNMITNNYNLILLATKLPTMDGLDTSRFIRYSQTFKDNNIPIVAFTNSKTRTEETYCKNVGINAYLTKPYNKELILTTVKNLLK